MPTLLDDVVISRAGSRVFDRTDRAAVDPDETCLRLMEITTRCGDMAVAEDE